MRLLGCMVRGFISDTTFPGSKRFAKVLDNKGGGFFSEGEEVGCLYELQLDGCDGAQVHSPKDPYKQLPLAIAGSFHYCTWLGLHANRTRF